METKLHEEWSPGPHTQGYSGLAHLASSMRNGPTEHFRRKMLLLLFNFLKRYKSYKNDITDQNKSTHEKHSLGNNFWLLRIFSTLFRSGKIQANQRNPKWQRHWPTGLCRGHTHTHTHTHTPSALLFSVSVKGQDLDHQNKLFYTLQCTDQHRKTHFLKSNGKAFCKRSMSLWNERTEACRVACIN